MVKLLMLLSVPICGYLWARGGKNNKWIRRIGVGLTISILGYIIFQDWKVLLICPFLFGAAACGYGVPDSTDEGSSLGRFWFERIREDSENRFNQSQETYFMTNLMTRITVSFLYAISLIPFLLFATFIYGFFLIIINTIFWSVYYPKEGTWKGLGVEEILVGAGLGLGAFLAIL